MFSILKQALAMLFTESAFWKRLGKLLSHPFVLLAFATVFATLAGAWLTNYYQIRAWAREKHFEVFSKGYSEAIGLVDDLSELMSKRLFGLRRVVWAAKEGEVSQLTKVWDDYYESVIDWNARLMLYKNRLTRFVDVEAAEAFASEQDAALSYSEGEPTSIHGEFLVAHQKVRAFFDCVKERCPDKNRQALLKDAQDQLNELGVAIEAFITACSGQIEYYASTTSL